MKGVLLIVALALALAGGPARAAPAPTPALKIVKLAPFTARGVHFQAHEHVRLVLTTGSERLVHHVVADRLGTFRAKFADTTIDRCSRFVLVAQGANGSRTALKVRPQCPPA
jgi:hypothetical protein